MDCNEKGRFHVFEARKKSGQDEDRALSRRIGTSKQIIER